MSLSENIRKYRLDKGYTQEQLGSLLGLSAQAVSKWETSETYPDGSLLVTLANVLDVSLDTLFGNRSASMKEITQNLVEFFASVPDGSEFQMMRDLCWQIQKAFFNCRMTIDMTYDPEEMKTQDLSSYILCDEGFTHVSNGRAPFFTLVPTYDDTLSEVIGDGEEIRKAFEALSSPETMRAILFIHRHNANYLFEKEVLNEMCGIEKAHIDRVIRDLTDLRLVWSDEIEIDGEIKTLYSAKTSHLIPALFLLANEMKNYCGGYCYQSALRNKPLL